MLNRRTPEPAFDDGENLSSGRRTERAESACSVCWKCWILLQHVGVVQTLPQPQRDDHSVLRGVTLPV
jgi:hypothetical protein